MIPVIAFVDRILTIFLGVSIVRRQNVEDLKAGFSKFSGKKEEVQWKELEHSAL